MVKKVSKRLKKLNKTAGLSPVAILATASGAITMAFLTTQLVSSGSSLILTGVISASAAIINGFYKVLISGVGKKTKEVVKTANTVLTSGATAKKESEDGEDEEEKTEEGPPSEESEDEDVKDRSETKRPFIEFLNRNNFLILLTVFILLSLGTVGVTKFLQDKEVIHMYTYETNEIREVQEVSMTEEDKQEILSDILYILDQQGDEELEEDQSFEDEEEEVEEDPEIDELDEEMKDEHKEILDEQLSLEKNLELLESKLIESERTVDKLSNDLKTSNRSVKELENRVKELERMNSELREERTG